MSKIALSKPSLSLKLLRTIAFGLLILASAGTIILTWPHAAVAPDMSQLSAVHHDYDLLLARIEKLQSHQRQQERTVIDDSLLQKKLSQIQTDTLNKQYYSANKDIHALAKQITAWEIALAKPLPKPKPTPAPVVATGNNHNFAPILLYHHLPSDFENQLKVLKERGYQSVSLQQVVDAHAGKSILPDKPVVITFDDGFADQINALPILEKYGYSAVFYIINGGQGSNYHIGVKRKANDPEGGDAYLTWDQIRLLDGSGYAEIGGHTVDHVDLAHQTPETQRMEIVDSKHEIEMEIGHTITAFCYPYGSYNATSIAVAQEAGFTSATTTLPGTDQSSAGPFTLRRIRSTYNLP